MWNKFALISITNIDWKIHRENFGNYQDFAGDFAKFSNILIYQKEKLHEGVILGGDNRT